MRKPVGRTFLMVKKFREAKNTSQANVGNGKQEHKETGQVAHP